MGLWNRLFGAVPAPEIRTVEKIVEKETVVEKTLYYPKDSVPVALYQVTTQVYRPSSGKAYDYGRHIPFTAGFTLDVEEALNFIDTRKGKSYAEISVTRAFKSSDGSVFLASGLAVVQIGLAWPDAKP